jgi:hypothetical protein
MTSGGYVSFSCVLVSSEVVISGGDVSLVFANHILVCSEVKVSYAVHKC